MIHERPMPTMTSASSFADLALRLRDFARGQGGLAAVEFAMVLPFMLMAYLGGIEIGDGVAIDRKVAITTRSVADLASRFTTIADSDMANILSASSTIIAPYSATPLAVTVSQVMIDTKGNATVAWSDANSNATPRAKNSAVTLPGTLATPCAQGAVCSYIMGEVKYNYTPTLGYVMTGTWALTNQIFMSPRNSACVIRNTSCTP
jgi:Flp pilus assembly protein TadG